MKVKIKIDETHCSLYPEKFINDIFEIDSISELIILMKDMDKNLFIEEIPYWHIEYNEKNYFELECVDLLLHKEWDL
jgi:hypothetical protein